MFQNNSADNPGCWSKIGRKGGIQKIQLSEDGCYKKHLLTHEMMHTAGHHHEHTRSDRDQHIHVNFSCIMHGEEHRFEKRNNTETFGLPYDHYSIMHYSPREYQRAINCKTMTSLNSQVPDYDIGLSTEMTDLDVKKILTMQQCTVPRK